MFTKTFIHVHSFNVDKSHGLVDPDYTFGDE